VSTSRCTDLSEKYDTSRLDLRPILLRTLAPSGKARAVGGGWVPAPWEQGLTGAWGGPASRWCAPVGSVAFRAAGTTSLIAVIRSLEAS